MLETSGLLVDFEGIDGSGKTTLSNRVAQALRAEGRAVLHLREGGRLGSPASEAIRALARDARHAALSDSTELLLNCAREVQLRDELAAPALARGDVVFADRSVFTHLATACAGRGLPAAAVLPVVEFAAGARWPDLVVLVDIEPWQAAARRRCRKLADSGPGGGGSRKKLAGEGLMLRVRDALRELARRDPARWIVVPTGERPLEESVALVLAAVRERLAAGARPAEPPALRGVELLPAPVAAYAEPAPPVDAESLREAFFARLERLEEADPAAAVWLAGGLALPEADRLRERLALRVPEVVARSLSGVDTPAAWTLRHALRKRVPRLVARSLAGMPESADAARLREELADEAPAEVARTLRRVPGRAAAELRERLASVAPAAVLESLVGSDEPAAWTLRDRFEPVAELAPALLHSLAGLGGLRAWDLRRRLGEAHAPALLRSLEGLGSDEAWALRERWWHRAPVPVLHGLSLVDEPRAWELRERLLERAPEALEGMAGVEGEAPARLRARGVRSWPAQAVRSLGPLVRTPAGRALLGAAIAIDPENPVIVRAALLGLQAAQAGEQARRAGGVG